MLRFIILLLILPNWCYAQKGFVDDFTDGDFTANPKWTGEVSKFEVNPSNQLQLNDQQASSPTYLATSSSIAEKGVWDFFVELDFAPSSSNFCKVYLMSDQEDFGQPLNGYFVQIGGQSGSADDVSLYRQDGSSTTKIIDGIDGTAANNPKLKIKVIKDRSANWELYIDTNPSFDNFKLQGVINDSTYSSSNYFGLYCKYTSSRSDKFFFDAFRVDSIELQDTIKPTIASLEVINEQSLSLTFNEAIDTISVKNIANFFVRKGIGNPSFITIDTSNKMKINLEFSNSFENGINYELIVSNVEDQSGNKIILDSASFLYFIPVLALKGDIVINEILFNPRTGGSDFVELYNRSEKILNLKDWTMANFDDNPIDNQKVITSQAYLFYPGEYLGLTEDLNNIINEYPNTKSNRFIEVLDLPSYNDKEGTVYVLNEKNTILDQVTYSESHHFELLNDKEGVSLERISVDRPSDDNTNFHSAAESVGFATPAYENSQFFSNILFQGKVAVDPTIFSPDNDGYKDVLNINYQFKAPGFVANVSVFDKNGRQVRSLVKNQLLGKKGTLSWNGITDDNAKARIGIYFIYFEAFHPNGNKEDFKEAIVVAGRL